MKSQIKVEVLDHGPLTKTETVVLRLLCMGLVKKKIADYLCRAYKTIDTHDENIKRKLEAHSSGEVVARAVAEGMVKITKSTPKIMTVFLALLMTNGVDDIQSRKKRNTKRTIETVSVTRTRSVII